MATFKNSSKEVAKPPQDCSRDQNFYGYLNWCGGCLPRFGPI